jgi:hypothetical protein
MGNNGEKNFGVNTSECWSNEILKCGHVTHDEGAIYFFAPSLGVFA